MVCGGRTVVAPGAVTWIVSGRGNESRFIVSLHTHTQTSQKIGFGLILSSHVFRIKKFSLFYYARCYGLRSISYFLQSRRYLLRLHYTRFLLDKHPKAISIWVTFRCKLINYLKTESHKLVNLSPNHDIIIQVPTNLIRTGGHTFHENFFSSCGERRSNIRTVVISRWN